MALEMTIIRTEYALLRYLITYPARLPEVEEQNLVSRDAKAFYRTLCVLSEQGANFTAENIAVEVSRHGSTLSDEQVQALLDWEAPGQSEFSYLYTSLRRDKAKYDIGRGTLRRLTEGTISKDALRVEDMRQLRDEIDSAVSLIEGGESAVIDPAEAFRRYEQDLARRISGGFHSSGSSHLDKYLTAGFEPKYFYLIYAQPGVGKSTFVTHLINGLVNVQIPVLYCPNEMALSTNLDRIVCEREQVPFAALYPKRDASEGVPQYVLDAVARQKRILSGCRLFRFIDKPSMSLREFQSLVRETKRLMGLAPGDYLIAFIDLLTKLRDFAGDNKASSYEDAVNLLDTICKEENIAVVGVVQGRRPSDKVKVETVEDLEKFRPTIEELKNSGALEERARVVLSLFRPKHFAMRRLPQDPMTAVMEDIGEIDILKQNLGGTGGRVKYLCNLELCSFYDYLDEQMAEQMMADDEQMIQEAEHVEV